MSLVPAFEIGVWNVWILMFYILIHALLLSLIFKDAMKQRQSSDNVQYTKTEKRINTARLILLVLIFIYSVFLPLRLGTVWFYAGLPIYLLGLIAYTIVMMNWVTPTPGEPATRGLYRYSRHPQYLTQGLLFVGVGVASASWAFLLYVIVSMILINILVTAEERFCLERFGQSYQAYLNMTPRWIGVPKSRKN